MKTDEQLRDSLAQVHMMNLDDTLNRPGLAECGFREGWSAARANPPRVEGFPESEFQAWAAGKTWDVDGNPLRDAARWGFERGKQVIAGGSVKKTEPDLIEHPDEQAVDRFAEAMKIKLALARAKGRHGWELCHPEDLSKMLRDHVEKGDPRDVANFCMMLWNLNAGISKPAPDERKVSEGKWVLWDGEYEKQEYIIRDLMSGRVYEAWPNAGRMHDMHGLNFFWMGGECEVWVLDAQSPTEPTREYDSNNCCGEKATLIEHENRVAHECKICETTFMSPRDIEENHKREKAEIMEQVRELAEAVAVADEEIADKGYCDMSKILEKARALVPFADKGGGT